MSNPPYVPSGEIDGLQPEVSRFEPRAALDGGPDGLDAYRAVLPELPRLLRRRLGIPRDRAGQDASVVPMATERFPTVADCTLTCRRDAAAWSCDRRSAALARRSRCPSSRCLGLDRLYRRTGL